MTHYQQSDYLVRKLDAADWHAYRALRLEALKTTPQVFSSNYQKESEYPDERWQEGLAEPSRGCFGLFYQNDMIGLTVVALDREHDDIAQLYASFIRPEHRGKGLSGLFYQARIDWARDKQCREIQVGHREDNVISKAANQRFGFEFTHAIEMVWPDGATAKDMRYKLSL